MICFISNIPGRFDVIPLRFFQIVSSVFHDQQILSGCIGLCGQLWKQKPTLRRTLHGLLFYSYYFKTFLKIHLLFKWLTLWVICSAQYSQGLASAFQSDWSLYFDKIIASPFFSFLCEICSHAWNHYHVLFHEPVSSVL